MYYYRGYDPDSGKIFNKVFDDENKAIDFARDNFYRFPHFTVKDEDGQTLDSDAIANNEERSIMDDMFPDEDSREGFDVDVFFGNE
jgi:hypothetical protein